MARDKLMKLAFSLLQGGVAYKHVRRFITELKDHVTDLEQEALNNGSDMENARAEAAVKLGDAEILAQEMLQRPELKSLGYRYPKIMLVAMPVILYFLTGILLVLLTIGVTELLTPDVLGNSDVIRAAPMSVVILMTLTKFMMMYGLPLLMSYLVLNYAINNQIKLKYYGLGLLILALLSSSVNVYLSWPDPANALEGSFSVSIDLIRVVFPPLFYLRLGACLLLVVCLKFFIEQKLQRALV